ncbi:phosphate ABC transporter substrate-binding protein PstS [Candidatus Nitrosotenuis sp. DW1]|uniref:phosphate ABC transporter substrate-binding protein PstS n=1 Tax=Candidatus Nitrosotenuis sp. DW1 TaxID=2259672 RepID=UPI0015CC389D|nr:phosphate ABC transporter substrate-binding protein PstS [Candidatus Nitrosotenuis sp. DW1]QLH08745.1 phosphate ABC transporter substrate-binding protein PstS [Candidatus Nitrosotenuis sp. DW1]
MRIIVASIVAIFAVSLVCQSALAQNQYTVTGAGATFPFPLLDLWRVKYNAEHPNINMNYQSIGSGGGVKQHIEKTVNFAATDAPLTTGELELVPDSLHIPEAIGGITVSYNVPEIPESGLKLTGKQIADIFLGKITKWNDPSVLETNPDLSLPDKNILVVHRSDGSGTTHVFTEYLDMVSQDWHDQIGFGKSIPWPAGVGAAGNEGVAATVRTTPYSIGYVELAYAFQNDMTFAYVENGDGTAFIEPSLETLSASAAGAASSLPQAHESWQGITINNAPGPNSYPITSFTYILLHQNLETATSSKEHAVETVNLIKWMITDGQKYSPELLYVPIPAEVTQIGLDGLDKVTYDGMPLSAGAMTEPQSLPSPDAKSGGCLIATAAFGSELAPQVQLLREVRDNVLLDTGSGMAFMGAFNNIYYSFSPSVADLERQNPVFKEVVRMAITPMLSTLSILNYVHIDSEHEMLGYGIGIILLNIGVYFVAPAIIVVKLRQKICKI